MPLDEGMRDPESQARAFTGTLRRRKRVEDAREDLRRNAGPGVEDIDADTALDRGEAHREDALAGLGDRHRFLRVLDQIEQHLLDLPVVRPDGRDRLELRDDLDPLALKLGAFQLEHPADRRLEAARPAVRRLRSGELQEALQHPRGARGVLDDHVETVVSLRRVVRRGQGQLRVGQYRG